MNGKSNKRGGLKGLKGQLLRGGALVLMLWAALPAMGQSYVFLYKNGNTVYFLYNNNRAVGRTETFNTSTCIFTGTGTSSSTFYNGDRYLQRNTNTLRFNTTSTTWTITTYGRVQNSNRYIRYYNNGWTSMENNNNPGTNVSHTVLFTYSNHDAALTNPTIDGADVLTATGTSDYSVAAKTTVQYHQFDGYSSTTDTTYYWYSSALQTSAPTETNVNSGTWSLTGNTIDATTYATVNTSNGTITVSSIPPTDLTMTLSCSVSANGVNKTATKTVHLLAENPSVPVISLFGTSQAQITCPSQNVTIYYTTNGNTPTESSTEYSGPFDINCPSTTVKAIAVRNGHSSTTASITLTCKVPTPVITLTGANATIAAGAGSPDGTKLYYTTDGTTPTDASTPYNDSPVTLTNTQTIKVIAVKSGYTNSDIASADYIVEGVNGGYVVLDDREEHSWSYYSDTRLPQMMRSLNPADVKITYNGNGTNNISTTNGTTPANDSWTQSASTVKVSHVAGEDQSTFVYFKTLERTDGSSSLNPTGRCAYKVIPNPFSVRPTYTYTSGDLNKYCGFYKWRVKKLSGGAIYDAASGGNSIAVGGTIDGDQTVYFAPSGEYGMGVELEALWARAYVTNNTTNLGTYVTGTNAYERNFHVVTSSTTAASYQKTYGCTVSSRYPDGTNGGGSVSAGFSANGPTKFENISITGATNSTWNANNKDLVVGRGVTGTVRNLYGLSTDGNTSFRFRIESGTYANLDFMGDGTGLSSGVMTAVMGCDYDRAKEDNTYPQVTTDIILGHSATIGSSGNKGAEAFNCTVKSGNYDMGGYGGGTQFYISNWGDPTTYAKRTLTVEGGIFSDISGGTEDDGTTDVLMVDIRIMGGTINGAVYGAAQRSEAEGHRRMIITGGEFKGWIAGGANGNDISQEAYNGKMTGNTYLYVGGRARIDSDSSNTLINRSVGGNVFGAGCGYDNSHNIGYVIGNTNVAIADEAYVERGVYGGGSFGYCQTSYTATIYLMGGTVDCIGGGVSANGSSYTSDVKGGVYGGACQNVAGTNYVKVYGGTVNGGVYGGGNVSGAVTGPINVDVYGTDPQPNSGYAIKQVFGGGNRAAFAGMPNVTVHCGDNISIGEVYGGGNAATVQGTNVVVEGGNRIGNVYGGCYGAAVTPNGTKVNIKGGTIEHVYGGNNASGDITGAIRVRAHKDSDCPMKIGELYGGGNRAGSAAGSIDIGCTGTYVEGVGGHADCNESDNRIGYELEGIGDVFGGANQANISTGITLTIDSGMVYRVFGGNNNSGSISGTITVNIQKTNPNTCGWYVGYVYGGGFNAPYNKNVDNNPSVNVTNGLVSHSVFGGGKGDYADITGNPRVTLSGTAQVGENVYGGGDAADVIGNTSVILKD